MMEFAPLIWIFMGTFGFVISWEFLKSEHPLINILYLGLFAFLGPIGMTIGVLFKLSEYMR